MAKLILISSEERQEFELAAFNSIGRHPDNTIQILDRIISKEHAQIQRTPDSRYLLRDLGSLNGTYIRGERVHEQILNDGDEIALGSTRLLYVENKTGDDAALQRVTIAPGMTESHIRQRIAAQAARDFLPERDLLDERQLRRDYEKLRISYELGKAVGTELDLDKLLPKILDKAFELLNADRGVILLMDSKGELVPRYVKQKDGREENIVLSKTVMAEVVAHKSAVLSSDATMDSRFSSAHSIIMQGIRSTMTVPLLIGDEILGIMHLDSQIATNAFTDKDLQVFTGIASQAAISIQNARLAKKIEQEAQTRAQISRLVPPNIVEQVVSGQLTIEKGGKQQEVTMLYSDIRGFTALSERHPPEEIVRMLNEYFEVMVDILFKHDGTLDKFVGDEIIGLFGAPLAIGDAAMKAVVCALDMKKALGEFNRTRGSEGHEPIKIGIGINTGRVVTGAIGSSKSMQYTAIGEAMNAASRLCGTAKAGEIIISEFTLSKLGGRVEAIALEPVLLKNIAKPMKIYNVVGIKDPEWNRDPTNV
jgi:adenylate cyclase